MGAPFQLRCPSCGASFAPSASQYSFDLIQPTERGPTLRRFLICGPCSAIALRGDDRARVLIAKVLRYIEMLRHAAH